MRGRRVQTGEHCRHASRTVRYVRARSGSGLSSGVAESVRNDNVSGVSQAAARAKYEAATMPDTCMERDTNMRQCDKVLAVDALGGISILKLGILKCHRYLCYLISTQYIAPVRFFYVLRPNGICSTVTEQTE